MLSPHHSGRPSLSWLSTPAISNAAMALLISPCMSPTAKIQGGQHEKCPMARPSTTAPENILRRIRRQRCPPSHDTLQRGSCKQLPEHLTEMHLCNPKGRMITRGHSQDIPKMRMRTCNYSSGCSDKSRWIWSRSRPALADNQRLARKDWRAGGGSGTRMVYDGQRLGQSSLLATQTSERNAWIDELRLLQPRHVMTETMFKSAWGTGAAKPCWPRHAEAGRLTVHALLQTIGKQRHSVVCMYLHWDGPRESQGELSQPHQEATGPVKKHSAEPPKRRTSQCML